MGFKFIQSLRSAWSVYKAFTISAVFHACRAGLKFYFISETPKRENSETIFIAEIEYFCNLWLITVNYVN